MKTTKHIILFQLLLLLALNSLPGKINAQITFQKVFTSLYSQDGLDVLPTSDGGYIIAGMTTNDIFNDTDVYIIKTNSAGETVWTKAYGGSLPDYASCVLKASDNNYFVLGYSQSFGGGDYDTYLLKINSSTGDTLWTKTYGSYGNEQGKEIIPTSDGNYMIVGYTNGLATSNYDAYLTKIDLDGNILWSQNYGGTAYEAGNSVKECIDGGFVLIGNTYSYGQGNCDAYVVKTNSTGGQLWTKTYGGANFDEGIYTYANADGSLMFCVRDSSAGAGDIDIRVIKTDANGVDIWNQTYGGDKKDTGKMIQPTSDGGFVIAGHSRSFGWVNPDMWIIKIDTDGDTVWTRHYGGSDHEHCYSVRQIADGGFIAVGKTESFSNYDEIIFLKLNSSGNMAAVSVNEIANNDKLNVFPNPTDGTLFINLEDLEIESSSLIISNVVGEIVYSEKINTSEKKIIDLNDQKPGMYLLTIQSTEKLITKKISLQ
ncbi:MAG: T9SS type A sorting domain-containing protein [Bacteroidota bacterium]